MEIIQMKPTYISTLFSLLSFHLDFYVLWKLRSVCKLWKDALDYFEKTKQINRLCHFEKEKCFGSIDLFKQNYYLYNWKFSSFVKKIEIPFLDSTIKNVGYFSETKNYWLESDSKFIIGEMNPSTQFKLKIIKVFEKEKCTILLKKGYSSTIERIKNSKLPFILLDKKNEKELGYIHFSTTFPKAYFCCDSICFFIFSEDDFYDIYWIFSSQWNQKTTLLKFQSAQIKKIGAIESVYSFDEFSKFSFSTNKEMTSMIYAKSNEYIILSVREKDIHSIKTYPKRDSLQSHQRILGLFGTLFGCLNTFEYSLYLYDVTTHTNRKILDGNDKLALDTTDKNDKQIFFNISYNENELILSPFSGKDTKYYRISANDYNEGKMATVIDYDKANYLLGKKDTTFESVIVYATDSESSFSCSASPTNACFTPFSIISCMEKIAGPPILSYFDLKKYNDYENGNKKKLYAWISFFISWSFEIPE